MTSNNSGNDDDEASKPRDPTKRPHEKYIPQAAPPALGAYTLSGWLALAFFCQEERLRSPEIACSGAKARFSVATETRAVGTARGAAAHFCDTNRNYGIQRSYHQNFNSVLYQIRYLQSFEVDICLKLHILAGTTKSAVFQQKHKKTLFWRIGIVLKSYQIKYKVHTMCLTG